MGAMAKFFNREERDETPTLVVVPPPKSIPPKEVPKIRSTTFQIALSYILMSWEGAKVIWELLGTAYFFLLTKKDIPAIQTNSLIQISLFSGAVTTLVIAWGALGYTLLAKIFLSAQFLRILIFLGSPLDDDTR